MEELKDLRLMAQNAMARFNAYEGEDFVLPKVFKEQVTEINSNSITYNQYSAIIETNGKQHGVLNIYMPNQWFYIASYFTEFYNELMKYRRYAMNVAGKERLKELNGNSLSLTEKSILERLNITAESKQRLERFITDYEWWGGAKTIDRGDFYVSPILYYAKLVNASQSFVADLCAFLADKQDLVQAIINSEEHEALSHKSRQSMPVTQEINDYYRPILSAIRTKPFLLLAGISGTGKSRIVRELARACWPIGDENRKKQRPDNYALIPVRPNWHDSTELLGYVSRIDGEKFVAGPFLRFIAKAWKNLDVPHFLCLDEMNLAPVEQYFAEYLSVVETRKVNDEGVICTDPIVENPEKRWYDDLMLEFFYDNQELHDRFLKEGISLPPNLIVMGTVNMDETTFSFSRKVLDRAMTIEMNEVNLRTGLGEEAEDLPDLSDCSILPDRLTAEEVYNEGTEDERDVLVMVLGWLKEINQVLEGTPFKIAYRTRNEVVLYVVNHIALGGQMLRAFDEAVNMKILPRIEGDNGKVGTLLDELIAVMEGLTDEATNPKETSPSLLKLGEMKRRMEKQYYCTYWS